CSKSRWERLSERTPKGNVVVTTEALPTFEVRHEACAAFALPWRSRPFRSHRARLAPRTRRRFDKHRSYAECRVATSIYRNSGGPVGARRDTFCRSGDAPRNIVVIRLAGDLGQLADTARTCCSTGVAVCNEPIRDYTTTCAAPAAAVATEQS